MSGNDTILHLPHGDFETLRLERLDDPSQRPKLLERMLEEENFGRAFPYWQRIAHAFGIADIRNNAPTRALLAEMLRTRHARSA